MKTLYMVMCHKNLEQVALLSKALTAGNGDVVIHVDSFVPEDEYASLKHTCLGGGAYLFDRTPYSRCSRHPVTC